MKKPVQILLFISLIFKTFPGIAQPGDNKNAFRQAFTEQLQMVEGLKP